MGTMQNYDYYVYTYLTQLPKTGIVMKIEMQLLKYTANISKSSLKCF